MIIPGRASFELLSTIQRHRAVLWRTTAVELRKRYAGSAFGILWIILQPALLLSIYLFVYMVVFRVRFPEFSEFDYVLFVFSGLIPYLGVMECLAAGTLAVKQNIHLVKNVMLPIDLVPARAVLIGMASQMVSTGILLVLLAVAGRLTLHVLWLPMAILLQYFLMLGIVLVLSSLAVVLLDISYFVNLSLLLLMFLSPIGFQPEMVPPILKGVLLFNPVYYLVETIRGATFYGAFPPLHVTAGLIGISTVIFICGSSFFRRFKGVLVDYE